MFGYMEDIVYLKTNVVPEPLFARWYAWPHLISPATAAMNILNRHVRIMQSYIMAPFAHAAAVRNPKMLGGPFMDYEGNKARDVKQLLDETVRQQAYLIDFAKDVRALNRMLCKEADGSSLEPLYERIPERLKGLVELVYDVNNQPSFRFYEALLYQETALYNPGYQSIMLYLIDHDERAFILSTPRLEDPDKLHLRMPFDHQGIDKLFEMQRTPGSYQEIKHLLQVPAENESLFRSFFTSEAPVPYAPYQGKGIRTRYFGHACILIETATVSILSDPVISYYYPTDVHRYTYTDLPDKIDYVVITHNHQDHILLETMLQLRHKIGHIVVPRNGNGSLQDPSLKLLFTQLGFRNVIEIDEFEKVELPGCVITGLPFIGEHSDLDIRTKLCHHVALKDHNILLMADSCNVEPRLYERIHKMIGDVDVLFLGMECDGAPLSYLYGPLMTEELPREKDFSRRLKGSNYREGMDLVKRFKPKDLFIYAMGQEPWLNYIMSLKYTDESNPIIASNQLIRECREEGVTAERLYGEKCLTYE